MTDTDRILKTHAEMESRGCFDRRTYGEPCQDISDEKLDLMVKSAEIDGWNSDEPDVDRLAGDISWLVDQVKRLRDQLEASR